MGKKNKKQKEYSKILLIQESILIWFVTLGMMFIALICILRGFTGSLPWLAAMVAFPWTAYGISQAFYYKKSTKENTEGGIKFEAVMAEVNATYGQAIKDAQEKIDWTTSENSIISPKDNKQVEEINLNYGI